MHCLFNGSINSSMTHGRINQSIVYRINQLVNSLSNQLSIQTTIASITNVINELIMISNVK